MLSIIEKVLLLQDVEILQSVSTEHLGYIAQITDEIECQEGEIIYTEGDAANAMYIVITGDVRLHRGDQDVLSAGPKSAFGIWALFDEEERVVSATSTSESRLLCLSKDDFHDVLSDHPDITRSVLRAMAKRLRSLVSAVSLPGNTTAE